MNNMEQFNHHLNQSVDKDSSNDVFIRKIVDDEIEKVIEQLDKTESVCIIGAGKCREFSLSIFIENFERVLITDIDTKSIPNEYSNCSIEQVEYSGFMSVDFFKEFEDLIDKTNDVILIDRFIIRKLNEIKKYLFLQEDFGTFDLVYISPIYTQLVYHQLLSVCDKARIKGYPNHLLKHVEKMFLDEMIGIINRFNKNVLSLLNEQGNLLVLSDIFEVKEGTQFFDKVVSNISSNERMDSIYDSYLKEFGMGLGDYGLYNLNLLMTEVSSEWVLWRFTNTVHYVVKMKIYKRMI